MLLEASKSSSSSKISKIKLDAFFLTDLDFSIFFTFVISRSTALSIEKLSASIPSVTAGSDSNSEFFETLTDDTD